MSKAKLMIEVDERIIEYIKERDLPLGMVDDLCRAIEHGTPITEGDMISRSALRTDFVDRYRKAEDWIVKAKDIFIKTRAEATRDFIGEVIMTIDKAPSIGGNQNE